MSLSDEERKAIVDYRIEKANTAMEDVRQAAAIERWSMAANRLYYAIYYAASALLISEGHEAHTHAGVINLVSKIYVTSGALEKEDGRLTRKIFEMRQAADYDDFIDVEKADIDEYLPKVEALVAKIIALIPSAK